MGAFVFSSGDNDPIKIGLINNSDSALSKNFSELVSKDPLFEITEGDEAMLRKELILGNQTAVVLIPPDFGSKNESNELTLLLDLSQVRQLASIRDAVDKSLLSIEREIRSMEPMFSLNIEDIKARPQRYIDFLLPGLLAFMLMNLSIGGSGFNIVEYRRNYYESKWLLQKVSSEHYQNWY